MVQTVMARKTMGRRRDRGGRPEERGRGPGRRPRARAAAWSQSLNECGGKVLCCHWGEDRRISLAHLGQFNLTHSLKLTLIITIIKVQEYAKFLPP